MKVAGSVRVRVGDALAGRPFLVNGVDHGFGQAAEGREARRQERLRLGGRVMRPDAHMMDRSTDGRALSAFANSTQRLMLTSPVQRDAQLQSMHCCSQITAQTPA